MSARRPASRSGLFAHADRAPNISLAKDPERQARGSLQMSYKLEDDYGVTEARRAVRRPQTRCRQGNEQEQETDKAEPRPLFERRSLRWCCRMRAPATASARR